MRKIYGLMGVLLALSIGGYLLPKETEALPGRILMPNAGGRVVFDHDKHMKEYGVACVQCHHDSYKPEDTGSCMTCHDKDMGYAKMPCKSCHDVDFGGDFKTNHVNMSGDMQVCAVCHHSVFELKDWNHDTHIPHDGHSSGLVCGDCHHEAHGLKPEACGDCHVPVGRNSGMYSSWRLLKDATHARCAECHEENLKGDVSNCMMCHEPVEAVKLRAEGRSIDTALTSCYTCHEQEPKKLIPNSMAAYHGLCIGCHREKGGPADECAQCHRK